MAERVVIQAEPGWYYSTGRGQGRWPVLAWLIGTTDSLSACVFVSADGKPCRSEPIQGIAYVTRIEDP